MADTREVPSTANLTELTNALCQDLKTAGWEGLTHLTNGSS